MSKSVCLEPLNRSGLVVRNRIHAQKAERLPIINICEILIDYRSFYKTLRNLDYIQNPLNFAGRYFFLEEKPRDKIIGNRMRMIVKRSYLRKPSSVANSTWLPTKFCRVLASRILTCTFYSTLRFPCAFDLCFPVALQHVGITLFVDYVVYHFTCTI